VRNRFFAVAAVLSLVSVSAAAQGLYPRDAPKQPGSATWLAQLAKLPPFDPPRTSDGKPDLRGTWGGPAVGIGETE